MQSSLSVFIWTSIIVVSMIGFSSANQQMAASNVADHLKKQRSLCNTFGGCGAARSFASNPKEKLDNQVVLIKQSNIDGISLPTIDRTGVIELIEDGDKLASSTMDSDYFDTNTFDPKPINH